MHRSAPLQPMSWRSGGQQAAGQGKQGKQDRRQHWSSTMASHPCCQKWSRTCGPCQPKSDTTAPLPAPPPAWAARRHPAGSRRLQAGQTGQEGSCYQLCQLTHTQRGCHITKQQAQHRHMPSRAACLIGLPAPGTPQTDPQPPAPRREGCLAQAGGWQRGESLLPPPECCRRRRPSGRPCSSRSRQHVQE